MLAAGLEFSSKAYKQIQFWHHLTVLVVNSVWNDVVAQVAVLLTVVAATFKVDT